MPPAGEKLYAQSPDLSALRDSIAIAVDGRPVLIAAAKPHPTTAAGVTVLALATHGLKSGVIRQAACRLQIDRQPGCELIECSVDAIAKWTER